MAPIPLVQQLHMGPQFFVAHGPWVGIWECEGGNVYTREGELWHRGPVTIFPPTGSPFFLPHLGSWGRSRYRGTGTESETFLSISACRLPAVCT